MNLVRQGVPIVYFRTYVGAAVKAVELGLMTTEALQNVSRRRRRRVAVVGGRWW